MSFWSSPLSPTLARHQWGIMHLTDCRAAIIGQNILTYRYMQVIGPERDCIICETCLLLPWWEYSADVFMSLYVVKAINPQKTLTTALSHPPTPTHTHPHTHDTHQRSLFRGLCGQVYRFPLQSLQHAEHIDG